MTAIKPLVWRPGNIGVSHEYADGANGIYHVWGDKLWAGPSYQLRQEANYAEDAKTAANEAHVRHLAKFLVSKPRKKWTKKTKKEPLLPLTCIAKGGRRRCMDCRCGLENPPHATAETWADYGR